MRAQGFEQFLDADTLKRIQNEFGRFLEGDWARDFKRQHAPAGQWYPHADVSMNETEFTVLMDVPGVAADAIKVTVQKGVLTISGNREPSSSTHSDRPSGQFHRQFTLPDGADESAINASSEHGVLTVTVALSELSTGARTIVVNG